MTEIDKIAEKLYRQIDDRVMVWLHERSKNSAMECIRAALVEVSDPTSRLAPVDRVGDAVPAAQEEGMPSPPPGRSG